MFVDKKFSFFWEIFSELDENLRGIFTRRETPEDQRAALGGTHRAGTASYRDPPLACMWDPPLLLVGPLSPLRRL